MKTLILTSILLSLSGCNVPNTKIQAAIKTCETKQGLYEIHLDMNSVWARCGDNTSNLVSVVQ